MCGPRFCSMKITQEVRDYAEENGINDLQSAINKGLGEKTVEFKQKGKKIYNEV